MHYHRVSVPKSKAKASATHVSRRCDAIAAAHRPDEAAAAHSILVYLFHIGMHAAAAEQQSKSGAVSFLGI